MVAGAGDGVKKIRGELLNGIILLAVAASILIESFEDSVTEELAAQVSRLAIPAGWEVLDDAVRREQYLRVSTNPCPSISRRWEEQVDSVVTTKDLEQIAAAADVTLAVDRPCQRAANSLGRAILCTGLGVEDGHDYQLSLSSAAPGSP